MDTKAQEHGYDGGCGVLRGSVVEWWIRFQAAVHFEVRKPFCDSHFSATKKATETKRLSGLGAHFHEQKVQIEKIPSTWSSTIP